MLDDSFHQRYCFSEEEQQLFKEKAVAVAHLFLHLPLPAISPCNKTRRQKMRLECEQPWLRAFCSLRRSGLVWQKTMPASAWRGAREGVWGTLCFSCWQGTPLQSLMGLSSQASWGSAGKLARGSLSHIWEVAGGSAPCNMSVTTQVVTE